MDSVIIEMVTVKTGVNEDVVEDVEIGAEEIGDVESVEDVDGVEAVADSVVASATTTAMMIRMKIPEASVEVSEEASVVMLEVMLVVIQELAVVSVVDSVVVGMISQLV